MQIYITLAAAVLGLALILTMVRIQKRPKQTLDPSLIPTTPLLILGGFIVMVAFVHLVNLFGMHTGRW